MVVWTLVQSKSEQRRKLNVNSKTRANSRYSTSKSFVVLIVLVYQSDMNNFTLHIRKI